MYLKKSSLSGVKRRSLGSLGVQRCDVDPVTNARVCSDDSAGSSPTSPTVVNCNGSVTPRYLPDTTTQKWDWNNPTPANWFFSGRSDPYSIVDLYTRQDGNAFAAVGPGGGFAYNDPRRTTIPAYSPCVIPAATPAPTIIASSLPAIVPITGTGIVPRPASLPAGSSLSSSLASIPSWAKYGGLAVAGLFAVKLLTGKR